jgi:hypothetical protein
MLNLLRHGNLLSLVRSEIGPAHGHVVSTAAESTAAETMSRREHHVGSHQRAAAEEVGAPAREGDGVGIAVGGGRDSSDDARLLEEQIRVGVGWREQTGRGQD